MHLMKISCNNMKIHSLIWVGAIFAADRGKNFYLVACECDYEFEYEFEFEFEYEYDLFVAESSGTW